MPEVLTRSFPRTAPSENPDVTAGPGAGAVAVGVVRTARPEQWIKNLLVFVAPAVAGGALSGSAVVGSVVAFVAFTLAAAGTYLLNDVTDRRADAHHPRKCHRPVASGLVPPALATVVGVALLIAAGVVPLLGGEWSLTAFVVAYLGATAAYNGGVKHVAFVELGMVCGFYALRIAGGAVAAGVAVPVEITAVLVATALVMIAGKRYAELRDHGGGRGTRRVLRDYSLARLRAIQVVAGLAAVGIYAAWALDRSHATGSTLFALSIVPVVLGVCRYGEILARGRGERPERLVWADRPLLASIVLTAVTFGLGTQGIS